MSWAFHMIYMYASGGCCGGGGSGSASGRVTAPRAIGEGVRGGDRTDF
jgi:hypothetical protein